MPEPEYRLTIKSMPEDMRPRERMRRVGPGALSAAELLAIILRTGTQEESALELAHRILLEPRGLRFLAEATIDELCSIKGVGLAKAAQVKAALELGRRLFCLEPDLKPVIRSPQEASNLVMEEMCYLDREHFRVILLNTKNRVLGVETVSIGSLNSSLVHPREVFKSAVQRSAAGVILVHNHPSGDPTPSSEDIEITRRLSDAGRVIGIEVLDHIIIGDHLFVSFKEKGLI
ncbi:MAG: DNA repair protein RadC [Thermacetogenium phaeum]|uniref:DNA repair protein RadC n=1 Tax=Thermacetogenium phaeum TaxID=85874 RepID=A0A124FK08_9THEO|nr:MAG: DNA repair protein RadC [Thermacetogenium phaeum]